MIENKILKLTKPTIAIDSMEAIDTNDAETKSINSSDPNKKAGAIMPLAQINKYKFGERELVRMTLSETDFLPEISLTILMSDGVFLTKSYPKDGDPLSIFIRSRMDEFNPIRLDFDITNVTASPSTDNTGNVVRYTFRGTLRVPGLHAEHCKAFKKKTSFDTLLDVATELGLGFASNEVNTSDTMTWLCPYDTYLRFAQDVTESSYKDDDSFFRTFVDMYYVMNFVNVNSQFGEKFEIEEALEVMNMQKDYTKGHDLEKQPTKLILTNHNDVRGSSSYISTYTLASDSGEILIANGYRRFAQFYDDSVGAVPAEKYQSQFVESLNSEDVGDDKMLQKGRIKEPEIFANTNKYKWLGLQTTNTHENFLYSIIQNWQNDQEIDKYELRVSLTACNFNIRRGMRLPVIITNIDNAVRNQMSEKPTKGEAFSFGYDKFLSGFYYVKDFKITWNADDGVFRQDVTLTRREWPIPPQGENPALG